MDGSRGFLMIDVLMAALLVTCAALAGFRIVSVSLGVFRASRDLLMISADADGRIARERLVDRSISNPNGVPAAAGVRTIDVLIGGRRYRAVFRKEVDRECTGMSRWTLTTGPEVEKGCFRRMEELCYVAGSYDPF